MGNAEVIPIGTEDERRQPVVDEPTRVPPHDTRAEQAIFGALLLRPEAIDRVLPILETGDFYHQQHKFLFQAVADLVARGDPVDLTTVRSELSKRALPELFVKTRLVKAGDTQLDYCGGADYLVDLTTHATTPANVAKYADIVRDHSLRRKAVALCMDASASAYYAENTGYGDPPLPTRELLARLVRDAMALEDRLNSHGKVVHFSELDGSKERIRESALARAQWHRSRPHFGFPALDNRIMGLPTPGATWIQGLHKMGKTILKNMALLETAYHHGWHTVSFDTEMDLESQTFDRLVKMVHGTGIEDLSPGDGLGEVDPGQLDIYVTLIDGIRQQANVTHVAANGMTVEEVVSRLRSIHRQRPVVLWIVDHVQQLHLRGQTHEAMQQAGQVFKREAMSLRNAFLGLTQVTISQDGLVFSKGGRGPEEASDLNIYVDRKGKTLAEKQDSPVGEISIQGSRNSKGGRWQTMLTDRMRFELAEQPPGEKRPVAHDGRSFSR